MDAIFHLVIALAWAAGIWQGRRHALRDAERQSAAFLKRAYDLELAICRVRRYMKRQTPLCDIAWALAQLDRATARASAEEGADEKEGNRQ